jgi:hypothetical protein
MWGRCGQDETGQDETGQDETGQDETISGHIRRKYWSSIAKRGLLKISVFVTTVGGI